MNRARASRHPVTGLAVAPKLESEENFLLVVRLTGRTKLTHCARSENPFTALLAGWNQTSLLRDQPGWRYSTPSGLDVDAVVADPGEHLVEGRLLVVPAIEQFPDALPLGPRYRTRRTPCGPGQRGEHRGK